jgi:cytochrome c oxidase subunit 2
MMHLTSLIPHQASTIAPEVDAITFGLLFFSGMIATLVFGLIVVFGIKYRRGSDSTRAISLAGENILEWGWTLGTLFIFIGFFIWGSIPYLRMHVAPQGATEIMVVGKQWMWKFQHANGLSELNALHVPIGQPIVLVMTSQDVIHSFFVPDFRIKQDVLPGRYTRVWFEAKEIGIFQLFCTQYCGTFHSSMTGKIISMAQADYQKWLENGLPSTDGAQPTMAGRGAHLFEQFGCVSCHGIKPGVSAPALSGIFGKLVTLSDGSSVLADENYIRESILNPKAKIVQGYQGVMPSYAGLANEEQILDLISYVKSLAGTPQGKGPIGPPSTSGVPLPPKSSHGKKL